MFESTHYKWYHLHVFYSYILADQTWTGLIFNRWTQADLFKSVVNMIQDF